MPTYVAAMLAGNGARSCLTPESRPPSRNGKDFQKEHRMRLAALQEQKLKEKLLSEARSKSASVRTRSSASASVRPCSASVAGKTNIPIVSPPSRHCHFDGTPPHITNDSDMSLAETPEKDLHTDRCVRVCGCGCLLLLL